ncbi:unnamed protein product [Periconia digitata]|uniref:FAD-binding PCMH-type domain-containing protein n=1 Tax=Periconia digitata TaxID=1303443 RepID=A0A9W4XM57_9PLEO|nr:unnamed protein product [Periconia digitata]
MLLRLQTPSAVAARALVAVLAFSSCAFALPPSPPPGPGKDVDIKPLVPKLSPNTHVYVPGSSEFGAYSIRWSSLSPPTPSVVIVPGTEKDVSEIVKYASEKNIPILAYNGHHGTLTTLGKMDRGIQINVNQLNSISIAQDSTTVTMGGGVNSKKLIDTLWDAGKQAVTGTCECVSYMGPALGGGHGWLQGHHGLIADQWTSMNVVLASGEMKTIDSNSDLWWGMQGAGHNFGIVTSVTAKIYPIEHTNWAIATMIFAGDKVEAVYQAANEHILQDGKQSEDIHNWSYWLNDDTLDPENPVIIMYIIQEGVDVVDSKYTQPFADIGPLVNNPQSGTYKDLAAWTNIAMDSPPCQDLGTNNPRFPIYTKAYNVSTQKTVYDAYATAIKGKDSPFYNSIFMFEDYASAGLRKRDNDASAFGFRDDHILAAPLIISTTGDTAQDEAVEKLGNELREMLREGTNCEELHTYVNYAYGTEGPESWYGYEPSRQERLKTLKTKYDPTGKFSFYAPVA